MLHGDARDPASVRDALGGREFDAVVDWVAYTPDHVRDDIDVFRGRAVIPFERGAREIVAWYDGEAARQHIDAWVDTVTDKLARAFRPGA